MLMLRGGIVTTRRDYTPDPEYLAAEVARLRGREKELLAAGELMAADLAGHAYGLREKYEFGPESVKRWWDAVAGGAAKEAGNG